MAQHAKNNTQNIMARLEKLELDIDFIKDKINSVGDVMLKEELEELEKSKEDVFELED